MAYFLDLSDERIRYLKEMLEGENEKVYDLENNFISEFSATDYFVFAPSKKFENKYLEKLPNDINLVCGNLSDEARGILFIKNIKHINLMADEIFTIKNANLTCEGVLSLIIQNTPKSIYENNILILGGGRIARGMAIMLSKLGVKYSIVSFNAIKFPQYYLYNNSCYFDYSFLKDLNNFDIIVNTIPAVIWDGEKIEKIKDKTLYIETASINSLDTELAKKFKFLPAPALPTKFTPYSAGKLIKDVIRGDNKIEK